MAADLIKQAEEREILAEEVAEAEERRTLLLEAAELYLAASRLCPEKEAPLFVQQAKECYIKSQRTETKIVPVVLQEKKISFREVAGLDHVKEKICLKIIEPFRHPELYHYFGKKVGGGILMYGPPGCGKTLIAEAAAYEAGCTFFSASVSSLVSKYVGETEKNISMLFKKAREAAPSIVFFDELEALGTERSNAAHYAKTAVSQLLVEINGLGNHDQQILLLGATNEPWNIDIALRRSGRFGDTLFIPPPDFKTRYKLLKQYLMGKPLAQDIRLLALAIETEGYSGADLVDLCDRAIERALYDSLTTKKRRQICMNDFIIALKGRKSSVAEWFTLAQRELKNDITFFKEILEYGQKFKNGVAV